MTEAEQIPLSATAGRRALRGRIILHSGIQLAGRGANALGAVVVLSLLTRYLGPAGFGRYTFVTGYIALFYVVTDLGTQSIAVRAMAQRPEGRLRNAGLLFSMKAILAGIAFLLACAAILIGPVSFRSPGVPVGVLIAAVGLLLAPFVGSAQALFQVALRMTIPSVADAAARYASLIVIALLALGAGATLSGPARLDAVLGAVTVGLICSAAITFAGAERLGPIRPLWSIADFTRMMRDALPVAVVSILGLIHYRIDIVLLTADSSIRNVGLYGVAAKLLDVSLGGLALFLGLVFPVISRLAAEDRRLLQRAFQRALDLVLIVGVGGAVFVSLLAPWIIRLLATGAFSAAALPVTIIAWAIPITFAETLFSQMIIAANRQVRAMPVIVVATVFNIALNLLLIPRLGAVAPAIVTVITESIAMAGLLWLLIREYRFGPSRVQLLKVLLAGAAAALVLGFGLRLSLPAAVSAAVVVYVGVLVTTRVTGLADLRAVLAR